jgi:transporter family-2 protein
VGVRGWPTGEPPTEPWLYLGGPIGVMFIAAAAVVVRVTGVLVLGLASIAGQVVGAVVIDLVLPTEGARPGVATLVGVALTLVAVGIAAVAPGRR